MPPRLAAAMIYSFIVCGRMTRSTGSYGPDPPRHGGGVSSSYKDVSRKMSSMSTFTVNDIIKQLELATSENERLRMAIAENNEFFEHRCAEMQESSKSECWRSKVFMGLRRQVLIGLVGEILLCNIPSFLL